MICLLDEWALIHNLISASNEFFNNKELCGWCSYSLFKVYAHVKHN